MTYPRTRNGHVDDGSLIKATNRRDRCPNCGSANYRETLSREECTSCGLVCDYWGGCTNAVYDAYSARQEAQQQRAQEARDREEQEAWEAWRNDCYDQDQ